MFLQDRGSAFPAESGTSAQETLCFVPGWSKRFEARALTRVSVPSRLDAEAKFT